MARLPTDSPCPFDLPPAEEPAVGRPLTYGTRVRFIGRYFDGFTEVRVEMLGHVVEDRGATAAPREGWAGTVFVGIRKEDIFIRP